MRQQSRAQDVGQAATAGGQATSVLLCTLVWCVLWQGELVAAQPPGVEQCTAGQVSCTAINGVHTLLCLLQSWLVAWPVALMAALRAAVLVACPVALMAALRAAVQLACPVALMAALRAAVLVACPVALMAALRAAVLVTGALPAARLGCGTRADGVLPCVHLDARLCGRCPLTAPFNLDV
jgi:hypothetical protein